MPIRPGDSAPDFARIEGRGSGAEAAGEPVPVPPVDDQGLPDSHIFQMPAMVPHFSDGSTDVLKRGRNQLGPGEVPESTEPMFPRQSAVPPDEAPPMDDEDATIELKRAASGRYAAPVSEATVTMSPPSPPAAVRATAAPVAAAAMAAAPTAAPNTATPAARTNSPAPAGGNLLFLLLLSYASAVTIGLIYLLLTRDPQTLQRHQLEDLRDPVDEAGTVRIYQRGADLPPGHALKLAESRRFGNIIVEPLRVTQGPVEFDHYSKNDRKKQSATPPVYKLWLRLTNASQDQTIAPLDALLMFKRELNREGELVSNTFLSPRGRAETGPLVFAYPAAQDSEWDMRGQQLGRKLAPGESLETFIPSDTEGLEQLADAGELSWRFHLRKGYARSGRGVTTLVEVGFSTADVQREGAGNGGKPAT